eukprot:15462610-Alexandrium_andersonii.AAC.1
MVARRPTGSAKRVAALLRMRRRREAWALAATRRTAERTSPPSLRSIESPESVGDLGRCGEINGLPAD